MQKTKLLERRLLCMTLKNCGWLSSFSSDPDLKLAVHTLSLRSGNQAGLRYFPPHSENTF